MWFINTFLHKRLFKHIHDLDLALEGNELDTPVLGEKNVLSKY